MSQVISTRLPDRTAERLKQLARQLGKTPSETSAILIEESLRESEFPYIEFRQSPLGRQPYLKNSSLALWEVIQIAQSYALDEQKTAAHFHRPLEWVRSALLRLKPSMKRHSNDSYPNWKQLRFLLIPCE